MFVVISTLASIPQAHAFVFLGNPDVSFRVDRPQGDYIDGDVTLDTLRIEDCSGGITDYTIDSVVDPVQGYTVTIAGGDLCTATWYWSTDMDVDGGTTTTPYTVRYTGGSISVPLSDDIDWVGLSPWSVVSGTMTGYGPKLLTWVD